MLKSTRNQVLLILLAISVFLFWTEWPGRQERVQPQTALNREKDGIHETLLGTESTREFAGAIEDSIYSQQNNQVQIDGTTFLEGEHESKLEDAIRNAMFYSQQGNQAQMATALNQAFDLTSTISSTPQRAESIAGVLAMAMSLQLNRKHTLSLVERAISWNETQDNERGKAHIFITSSRAYARFNEIERAVNLIERTALLLPTISDKNMQSEVVGQLQLLIMEEMSEKQQSKSFLPVLESAHSFAEHIQHPSFQIQALVYIAESYTRRGNSHQSALVLSSLISKLEAISVSTLNENEIFPLQSIYFFLSTALQMAPRLDSVDNVRVLERASRFSRSLQAQPQGKAFISALVARGYMSLPNESQAAQLVRECLDVTANIPDVRLRATVLENVTETVKKMDDSAVATTLLEEILKQTNRLDTHELEQPLREKVSHAFSTLGDRDRATAVLKQL